jgi:host factor-I protein
MESKPAQNIQDTFLNTVRKDKTPITIYLVSGVKLTGKIRSFISTVVSNRSVIHTEHRPGAVATGLGPTAVAPPTVPQAAEQR